ncbi:acyl-CoA dehydrogenase [Phytohabitans rumicis]|uniref:Acyl-CoA dehydrogenase n=2 Tax=Phytohabitans rumicis TaxID=1076125 RepID=A0A6V8L225_9ACTN|nr:acyl-CoA dehydrogenase [Phytohabitans rumicis]
MAARPATGARRLERLLDGPEADVVFAPERIADHDAAEAFPVDACRWLDEVGLPAYYVPAAYGGALHSFEDLVRLARGVARRDLTVAVAHAKTFLGAASAWALPPGPSTVPAQTLARAILAGVPVCWALTERGHGSDLLAAEVTAVREGGGYRVDGEKWLVNNATRAGIVCLHARTDPAGGPRGFSLLLVDKRTLADAAYHCLPKVRTHGIRGADISGIAFTGARVPASALVGPEGAGTETVLRALQLTRTVCVALSLGAADHALALTHRYVTERELYGGHLRELPYVRRTLGRLYAKLFAAEAVGAVGVRGVHTVPGELSVLSAVLKAFVPSLVDNLVAGCGELLGARAFLTGIPIYGAFGKVERDHRVVGVFDGSTFVNRAALVNQFPLLARTYRTRPASVDDLAPTADLDRPVPPFDPAGLELLSRSGCLPLRGLASAVAALRARLPGTACAALAQALLSACDAVHDEMSCHRPRGRDVPASAFHLAERYEMCVAGAAAVHVWLHNDGRPGTGPLWRDGLWLSAVLADLLDRLLPGTPGVPATASGTGGVFTELFAAIEAEPGLRPSILGPGSAREAAA